MTMPDRAPLRAIEEVRAAGLDEARRAAVERQHGRGKLTARERIAKLLDAGSFVEMGALVAPTRDTSFAGTVDAPADGVITGTGNLDGRPVAVASFDFMVAGGSNGSSGSLKMKRLVALARDEGVPLVLYLDGGGHRLQEGLDSWHFAWGYDVFADMVALSGWVPVVAVMAGPNFGGPTNFAALSDFEVMVRGISAMGIAGPALVKAANGEDISKEELGGADTQAARGVAHLAVDSESEAVDAVRAYLSFLPSNSAGGPVLIENADPLPEHEARLDDVVPSNPRASYDVRAVIRGLVDDCSILEIAPSHAPNIVTSLARLGGRPVGVIANQPQHMGGALDSAACEKVAHFIATCDAFGVTLLSLIDVPGFLGGSAAEAAQLARRSGRLLYEFGQASVPRMSVVMRKGYGAGYIAMGGGRSFAADVALAWPTAIIAATGVDAALDIAYRREIESAADPEAKRIELTTDLMQHVTPLAAGRGFGVDDVITASCTRERLLSALRRKPVRHRRSEPPKARGRGSG